MKPSEALRQYRDEVLALANQHRVRTLKVFGSVARGDDTEDSDLDLIAEFEDDATLFNSFASQEALLYHRVQLATGLGLHPMIREQVLLEVRAL
jgi:predicted nucleotidyltransferase